MGESNLEKYTDQEGSVSCSSEYQSKPQNFANIDFTFLLSVLLNPVSPQISLKSFQ